MAGRKVQPVLSRYAATFLWSLLAFLFLCILFVSSRKSDLSQSIYTLDYGIGVQIQGLIEHHQFGGVYLYHNYMVRASRMPIIPLLGAMSGFLSHKLLAFFLLKNTILFALWASALLLLGKRYSISSKWLLLTIGLFLLSPYSLSIAGAVEVEEGYLLQLLVLLFVLLLTADRTRDFVAIGSVIGIIYLTKSSMLPVCLAAAAYAWIFALYRRRISAQDIRVPPHSFSSNCDWLLGGIHLQAYRRLGGRRGCIIVERLEFL